MKNFIVTQKTDLLDLAKFLKTKHPNGGIFLLKGTLGAGKTSLVEQFSSLFSADLVSSPTFCILNIYAQDIYHYDIYKIGSKEFIASALAENLELKGFHFVEWADDLLQNYLQDLGLDYKTISIKIKQNNREITYA